jgi:hypothetical protein
MLKVRDRPFYRRMKWASVLTSPCLQLLRPECSRFITPGLESEISRVIERLINTLGSPQIAIDERHTPKLYSRFLARLLAKPKRDVAAHGRMPQHEPPTQQMPTNQGAPMYQQPLLWPQDFTWNRPLQAEPPQASHSASSTHVVEVQREKRKWSGAEDSDRSHRKRRIVLKANEQRRAQDQCVTEVAWEQAGRNRGLDLEPREKIVS